MTMFSAAPLRLFWSIEKSVLPPSPGTTISPSMMTEPAPTVSASLAILRKRMVQS